jgi:hypothetical protein
MSWSILDGEFELFAEVFVVLVVVVVVVSLVGILNGTACTLDVLLAELALLTDDDGFE